LESRTLIESCESVLLDVHPRTVKQANQAMACRK